MSTHVAALPRETHHILDIFVGRPQLSLSPIRVAQGGRYFETFTGEPFLFLGPNDAISWPGLAALYRRRDIAGVEAYLEDLANNGVNMLRLMLEYAHRDGRYFERPAGRFNVAMVRLWDDLFARCESFGIRVLLAPWDNFWMARRWKKHPYCAENGGPAHSPQDFFTQDATIETIIRRLHFVIERWGDNPAFAAWDLFNEIHPHWGGTAQQQSETIERISNAVREKELALWGWTRPQTVSIFGPQPEPEYEELIFRHPNLDFATTHIYCKGAIDFPKNTVSSALEMAHWVRYALERIAPNRPFTDSEHGPIHLFNQHRKTLPEAFDDEYERHMMWAHLASGGAGSGMRWPARHPHLTTSGTRKAIGNMAGFCGLIDWRHFTPRDANADITLSRRDREVSDWLVFACRDEHQAVAWLLRGNPKRNAPGCLPQIEPQKGVSMKVRGLAPGDYKVAFWNTTAQRTEHADGLCAQVANDGTLRFDLPPLKNDLALAISPLRT